MMQFMIIGLPRSMTTWAANWLSSPGFTVVHDPLYQAHYSKWSGLFDAVSCTGIWRWPGWVNAQTCRKLILRRPEAEVIAALGQIGDMHVPVAGGDAVLDSILGWHVACHDLLNPDTARAIWEWLRPEVPFDAQRHAELCRWRVEPCLQVTASADADLLNQLLLELRTA